MSLPEKLTFKTTPFAHQLDCLEKSWSMKNYALFLEMGCGKSKVLIDTAAALHHAGKIDAVLLIAPKGVYMNWVDKELPTHWPDDIPIISSYWQSPAKPELQDTWRKFKTFKGLRWMSMNVEAFSYESGLKFASSFINAYGERLLIGIDESTTIKNISAQRTKNIIALGKKAAYRRIMTGDPVPKGPIDMYSQCCFLSPHLLGYTSFYAFRARYCIMVERTGGNRSFKMITGYQRLDELKESIKPFSYRVTKDECLDLPPKVYQTWDVELSKEQLKLYKQMKDEAVALLRGGEVVTAPMVITQLLRLHQITCGFLKTDDGTEIDLPNPRIDALMDVLAGTNGKVIIWATYRNNIKKILKALEDEYGKDSVVSYYGDTDSEERRAAVQGFQNGTVRFFVGNPATGRFGLTLTASASVVYFSNPYDLEHRTQSEDRVHRIGQTASSVNYVDLVCKNTVDERIIKALRSKRKISAIINGDELKEWFA